MGVKQTEALKLAQIAMRGVWAVGLTGSNVHSFEAAMERVEEALAEQPAQQQETEHIIHSNGRYSPLLTHMMNKRVQSGIKQVIELYDSPEQPAQQEPFCYHDGRNIVGKEFADHSDVFPLYTRPQAREPLTDEQIDEAQDAAEESFHAMNKGLKPRPLSERASYFDWHLARAIEAAHGIGEKK